jgi:hypothetical protein
MGRRKQAGVRQEEALDRQESRNGWERTGIAIGEIQAGKGHERKVDRQTWAGRDRETGWDFGKERFI